MNPPRVRGQERQEMLAAIGNHVEPLPRPALQSRSALGVNHNIHSVNCCRLIGLDKDANSTPGSLFERLAELFERLWEYVEDRGLLALQEHLPAPLEHLIDGMQLVHPIVFWCGSQ